MIMWGVEDIDRNNSSCHNDDDRTQDLSKCELGSNSGE